MKIIYLMKLAAISSHNFDILFVVLVVEWVFVPFPSLLSSSWLRLRCNSALLKWWSLTILGLWCMTKTWWLVNHQCSKGGNLSPDHLKAWGLFWGAPNRLLLLDWICALLEDTTNTFWKALSAWILFCDVDH